MKIWVVIPVYNHEHAIATVIAGLKESGLPILMVDDGSSPGCAHALVALSQSAEVELLRLPVNGGKGAAVMAGMRHVSARGATHVLQIDADGQHDTRDVPKFIAKAQAHPDAVINGVPVYDSSVPKARLYGRYLTHVWVWINTLSLRIKDSMCGFRLYPLNAALDVVNGERIGSRMDFDPEILVRMFWRGTPVINVATPVRYPLDGVSHFDVLRDNVRISKMHARLFFGMLRRLPTLLMQRMARG